MAYTTVANVRAHDAAIFTTTVVSDTVVGSAIFYADSIINACIAKRYTVPVSSTPDILVSASNDIAAFRLLSTLTTQQKPANIDWMKERAKEAKALLKDICNGDMSLVYADGSIVPGKSGIIVSSTSAWQPTFNNLDAIDQVIDPNRLSTELDEVT